MRSPFVFILLLLASLPAYATTWYVGGQGDDRATGLSPAKAFRTLQHAADLTSPGDDVLILDGTYSLADAHSNANVLLITRPGAPTKWITFKAAAGQHPSLISHGWNAILLGPSAAYISIEGLRISGNNQNIDRTQALVRGSTVNVTPDPTYDGNCVSIDGRMGTPTVRPHHIRILNNIIGNCGGGGISTIQADYVTISGNTVFNSAWYSIFGCSGISMLESWNSDDSTAIKMTVTGNRVFNNRELVPWIKAGRITDGEGIIIDTLRSPTLGFYRGRTLVADNVLYGNGSAAIEVFRSDHVDVLNNSTNVDLQVPQEIANGELNLNDVSDVRAANNIFVSSASGNPIVIIPNKSCGCTLSSNLVFGARSRTASVDSTTTVSADPLFAGADDLQLRTGSPAAGSALKSTASPYDFFGHPRPAGPWDRGAYQH